MVHAAQHHKDGGVGREFDDEINLTEIEVTALLVIKVAAVGNGTEIVDEIEKVAMFKGNSVPAVEGDRGINGVGKVVDELGVVFKKGA